LRWIERWFTWSLDSVVYLVVKDLPRTIMPILYACTVDPIYHVAEQNSTEEIGGIIEQDRAYSLRTGIALKLLQQLPTVQQLCPGGSAQYGRGTDEGAPRVPVTVRYAYPSDLILILELV
jgi:hypothetical protein